MSVEISGPQGYEYQYLVTLYLALKTINKDDIEIFVEKKNNEDAQIIYLENGFRKILDIQAKKNTDQIELKEFGKWISHFEGRSWKANLLSKLQKDKNRFVVFVTKARCKDEVSFFVNNDHFAESLNNTFGNDLLLSIKENIITNYNDKTQLIRNRRGFCKDFNKTTSKSDFKNLLNRMIIWDRCDYDYIENRIKTILKHQFYVPESQLDGLVFNLIDLVRTGRDNGHNISQNILRLLEDYNGHRVFIYDNNYLRRNEVDDCKNTLQENNILLLTGLSQCGKSFIAREVGQIFQDNGFTLNETDEILGQGEAYQFIRHISSEDRLCILSDPFGHADVNINSNELLTILRNLIKDLRAHRKLIVTTRQDILLKVFNKKDIKECSLLGNSWLNMTLTDRVVAHSIWEKYFGTDEKSNYLFTEIECYLKQNEASDFLQPGQIAHLYTEGSIDELLSEPISKVVEKARIDSQELANKIIVRGQKCTNVMISLALGASTVSPITFEHLAFLLDVSDEKPSLVENRSTLTEISLGSNIDDVKTPFPQYKEQYTLDEEYIGELNFLQTHRYIRINSDQSIVFLHPVYQQAGKILFKDYIDNALYIDKLFLLSKKGIGALSKQVSLIALKVLEEVYTETYKEDIKQVLLLGLNSIFPSIKDSVISFFDTRINNLTEDQQQQFSDALSFRDTPSDGGILWYQGEPYFNTSEKRSSSSYMRWAAKTQNEPDNITIKKLLEGDKVPGEHIWTILNDRNKTFESREDEEILQRALSYEESFIREKAIYLLFKNFGFTYSNIGIYLDKYEHPNVIFKLFNGALQSWNKYSGECKLEILEFIKTVFPRMSVAKRFKRFLENFGDQHYRDGIYWGELSDPGKMEVWDAWYQLIIELMDQFPSKYEQMNEPHLSHALDISLKYIKDEIKVVKIANAWLNWLDKYTEYKLPDDYGMSITDYLIQGTQYNHEVRKEVIERLLNTANTSFITTHVMHLIDNWALLHISEKDNLKELLLSERTDVDWIKAVVITRQHVPEEVQIKLFGDTLLDNGAKEIVSKLDNILLEYSLNVHCGYPQPLWWNGYHHCNYDIWDRVIEQVLESRSDRSFDIALRELTDSLINLSDRFPTGFQLWDSINKSADKEIREKIFFRLMHETISQNQANKDVLWSTFFNYCDELDRAKYIEKIISDIEGIQNHHSSYTELFEVFEPAFLEKELLPNLKSDYIVLQLADLAKDIETGKRLKEEFMTVIYSLYNNIPPRLLASDELALALLKNLNIENDELTKIIKKTKKSRYAIDERRKKYDDHYKIDNWNE